MDGFTSMMDPSIIDEGWKKLYNKYYRKLELYKMAWGDKVSLQRSTLVSASCSGALAIRRSHTKIVDISASSMISQIETYTSSGALIAQFPEPKEVIKLGWDDSEKLIVVVRDGTIIVMDIFGQIQNRIERPELRESGGIIAAHIWGLGAVLLTQHLQFYCLMDYRNPFVVKLKDPQLISPPTSWTVIEPQAYGGMSRTGVQVLVATATGTILLITVSETLDLQLRNGPFTLMSVDPTGKLLACYTANGNIWITSSDFSQNVSTFETGRSTPPKQLLWCGTDSVLCYWEDNTSSQILVVGPANTSLQYKYDHTHLALIGEPDGTRIISDSHCEFLQLVPDAVEAVRRLEGPAATLCEAYDEYEKPSPRCDELLRKLKEHLKMAVDEVLAAASMEVDLLRQQRLLKAVSLGKTFCDGYAPHEFVRVCKTLRVLNQVRDPRYGIPLTYTQFGILGPQILVERLLGRRLHAMAYNICEYLGLNSDNVMIHWACTKVKLASSTPENDESNRMLVQQIVEKLANNPGISYADIARTALLNLKRPKLATLLLDHEPRSRDQVPLLLEMGQEDLAIQKAILSGDTDLVHIVVLHLKEKIKRTDEFLNFISKYEIALSLYIKYCKEQDPDALKLVYSFMNRPDLAAFTHVRQAFATADPTARIASIKSATDIYKQQGSNSLMYNLADDECGLLRAQQQLEAKTKAQFIGSSISATIYRTILLGDEDYAHKLSKNYNVPDKRYWWIKIRALAEIGAWESLEKFAKDKTSPIGYEPFSEVCLQQNNPNEAIKYVKKMKSPASKVKWLCKLGQWSDAYMVARDSKDGNLLVQIRKECPDPRINAQIDDQLRQM